MLVVYIPLPSVSHLSKSSTLNGLFPNVNWSQPTPAVMGSGLTMMSVDAPYPSDEWKAVREKMYMKGAIDADWAAHKAHLVLSMRLSPSLQERIEFAMTALKIASELGVNMVLMSSTQTDLTFVAGNVAGQMPLLSTSGFQASLTPEGGLQFRLAGLSLLLGQDYAINLATSNDIDPAILFFQQRMEEAIRLNKNYVDNEVFAPVQNLPSFTSQIFLDEKTGVEVVVFQ